MQIFIHCKTTLHVSGVTVPIIRSIKNCTRRLRYRSCYLYRYSPPTWSGLDWLYESITWSSTLSTLLVEQVISSIWINRITTRPRWKFTICTATNDLTLYSFSSLYIFATWGWPTVVETFRQPNKTDTKTVVFWRTYLLLICINHNGDDESEDLKHDVCINVSVNEHLTCITLLIPVPDNGIIKKVPK